MDEVIRQLSIYARGMWQYRWWGLLAAWLFGIAGAITVYILPDKYQASARIFVDTQSVLKPLMAGLAVPTDSSQQVAMLSKTLISRPNIEKLIRMADLDLKVKNKDQREALIDDVYSRLKIIEGGRDNLYSLAFMDSDPERAKRVVQSMVSIFVESGLGDKRKDTDTARRFIEEQIRNYEQKLDEAESRLKEFRLKHMGTFGESGRDLVAQIAEVNTKLNQAQLELREAQNSRDALNKQLEGEAPVFLPDASNGGSISDVAIPELDGRIDAMKKNLDSLLQRYTEQHPDVIGTRKVIEDLEKQKAQEIKARQKKAGSGGAASSVNTNPVYQQLKVSMAELDARVASLQTRVAEFQARANQLQGAAKMGPEVEQELAQLNRDYEVHKKNYESLVARRESANISVEMESTSGVAEFRLIDPPSVPSKPAAPNRVLLMPLMGLLAMILGALVAFAMSQIRPTVLDAKGLRDLTGLPILGSVSMTPSPQRIRRERRGLAAFAAVLVSLISAFGGMTMFLILMARSA